MKKIIIFGGSSGIGLSTAKAAAAQGHNIILVSSNKTRLDEALKSLPKGRHEAHAVDLGNEENIKTFFAKTGPFDHLVYTAGENISLSLIDDTDLGKAKAYFDIRYWGAVAAVKYGHPKINPGGSISLIGGTASARPNKGWFLGASITAAMEGFTRAMALELAPIRVNLVAPGVTRTNLWNSLPEASRNALYESETKRLPAGRVGEPEDIARTFTFLMEQPYMTGQVLLVDGGAVLV